MVGGCLEYLSLIVGYQALLLLAALLYGLALWTGRRYLGGSAAAGVPVPASAVT